MLNDVPYSVTVDPDNPADPSDDDPGAIGVVSGSTAAITLLRLRDGEEAVVTPTGPFYDLDVSDPKSVMAALLAWTNVTGTSGDVPEVVPPTIEGVVY